jgi:hypothetical protein
MRTTHTKRALTGLAAVGTIAGLVGFGGAAQAATTSTRDILVNDFQTEHTVNSCTGDLGTFSRHFNGFVHVTERTNGTFHFNALLTADDATFTPDDPSLPTYVGKELVHTSETSNSSTTTITFVLRFWATGPDGSRVAAQEVEHLTVDASSGVVSFEKGVLKCD